MSSSISDEKSVVNFEQISSLKLSLNELVDEAKSLFDALDATSNMIREFESCLSKIKAHFPFQYIIQEGEESLPKPCDERHNALFPYPQSYKTKIYWIIAWEKDDEKDNYRLFLREEEREIVSYYLEPYPPEDGLHFHRPDRCSEEKGSKILLKKPLIETDLPTRLRYSEHIIPFVTLFKEYLRKCRMAISKGSNPFEVADINW